MRRHADRLAIFRRAGVAPRSIEVRFDDLTVEASAYVGSRSQPSVLNFYRDLLEVSTRPASLRP